MPLITSLQELMKETRETYHIGDEDYLKALRLFLCNDDALYHHSHRITYADEQHHWFITSRTSESLPRQSKVWTS